MAKGSCDPRANQAWLPGIQTPYPQSALQASALVWAGVHLSRSVPCQVEEWSDLGALQAENPLKKHEHFQGNLPAVWRGHRLFASCTRLDEPLAGGRSQLQDVS